MGRRAGALTALAILVSAATLASQSPPAEFPDWMKDLLPKTADEKARAGAFDSSGGFPLELGGHRVATACGDIARGSTTRLYSEYVADLACGFDSIVVASSNPITSRLNNRGTFIFTEHAMPVDRWLFPPSTSATEVEVLVEGGTVNVGSQSTRVSVGEDLKAGRRYLLFLRRVSGTNAFVISGTALHEALGWTNRLTGLPMRPIPDEIAKNEIPFDRFIDDLAIAAGNCRPPTRFGAAS